MRFANREQMRELDRRAIEECGVPGRLLMERAGHGVARAAWMMLGEIPNGRRTVTVLAGRGNNGGDGFVAARHLAGWGARVKAIVAAGPAGISGDALHHLKLMENAGVTPEFFESENEWLDWARGPCDADLIVDAILGTGASGAPRGAPAAAIRAAAAKSDRSLVLAVDVPSGMDADTGEAPGEAVPADLTVTFGLPKTGMAVPEAWKFTGSVLVEDIGLPVLEPAGVEPRAGLVTPLDFSVAFAPRPRHAHKGDFGRVCVIAGSAGYAGAAAMAARAACRAGAGLVSVLTARSVAPVVAAMVPEAMVHGIDETAEHAPSLRGLAGQTAVLETSDVFLVGPGMTTNEDTYLIVTQLLDITAGRPLVVDADALNACVGRLDVFARTRARVVLTPHPGELARLTRESVAAIQADRTRAALAAACLGRCAVVLKGAGTVVAAPDGAARLNLTGNPGMATGGTGDVLAGMIAGLSAQTPDICRAAEAAVWCHGLAGDRASWNGSQAGLVATDILQLLPSTLRMAMRR